jgi:hypothetical protein
MSEKRYTIAVDFDGVIHSYTSPWVSAEVIPDPPVEGAIEWLTEIAKKFEVVIFTTRGQTLAGRQAVGQWLRNQGCEWPRGMGPRVTAEKPPALVYIDDRAWRFEGTFPTAHEIHMARPWNKRPARAAGQAPDPQRDAVAQALYEHEMEEMQRPFSWRQLAPMNKDRYRRRADAAVGALA